MISTAWEAILFLLAATGLATLFTWLFAWLDRPAEGYSLTILPVRPQDEPLEQLLRWSYDNLNRMRWPRRGRLLLLDLGVDPFKRQILEAFARQHTGVALCVPERLETELEALDATVYKLLQIVLY